MLNYGADMDVFLGQFKEMVQSIVVKQIVKAGKYETVDMKRSADKYLAMKEGLMEWSSFGNFDPEVLEAAGISSSIFVEAQYNKDIIPYELRDLCMRLERDFIIEKYVEKNNYYRTLNGEPTVEEIDNGDFIFIGKNTEGLSSDVAVHLLPVSEKDHLNNCYLLDELKSRYPDKEWLNHLGARAVSYYNARRANNYDILYLKKTNNITIYNNFIRYYASARDYVMRGLYSNEDRRLYDNYDSFMGLIILVMAINRMLASIFEQGVTREFYDDNLIRTFFECFNLPYEPTIDVKYQRMIAKRLNLLLQVKSSNQVLFDITELFNYSHVNIYKYYLVKDYRKDLNYDPIIEYKTVVDEYGNAVRVMDPDKSYDIHFQKVNIKSEDPFIEISDPANRVEYHSITGEDPYWIDDSDLLNKIYNNRFNSILTKYMSIDVMFDISKIMYETCHAIRLIIDRNAETKKIKITIPYVTEPVSLYDVVIFLCALVAKKFSLKGEIPIRSDKIATIYGFNFKTDIEYLREEILKDIEGQYGTFSHVDPEFLKYLKDISIVTLEDVRTLYENIHQLRLFLDTAMRKTTDLKAYQAYQKLYNSLLISEDLPEVYTKNDGSYAKTYLELLADRRPDLKEVVDGTTAGYYAKDSEGLGEIYDNMSINGKINKVLDSISDISEELDELRFVNEKSEIVNNITKLVNQFKSYTVDYNQSGIIYLLKDPHTCFLKILDSMYHYTSEKYLKDDIKELFDDVISHFIVLRKHKDKLNLKSSSDNYLAFSKFLLRKFMRLIHKITDMMKEKYGRDDIYPTDVLTDVEKNIVYPMLFAKFKEKIYLYTTREYQHYIHFDSTHFWAENVDMILFGEDSRTSINFIDSLTYGKEAITYSMLLSMVENILIDVYNKYDQPIDFIHELVVNAIKDRSHIIEVIDTIAETQKITVPYEQHVQLPNWLDIQRMIRRYDYNHLKVMIALIDKNMRYDMAIEILDFSINESLFDIDHELKFSNIEFDTRKDSTLSNYTNITYDGYWHLDKEAYSNLNIFDIGGYWNIDLSRSYNLTLNDLYYIYKTKNYFDIMTFYRKVEENVTFTIPNPIKLNHIITSFDVNMYLGHRLFIHNFISSSHSDIELSTSIDLKNKSFIYKIEDLIQALEIYDSLSYVEKNYFIKDVFLPKIKTYWFKNSYMSDTLHLKWNESIYTTIFIDHFIYLINRFDMICRFDRYDILRLDDNIKTFDVNQDINHMIDFTNILEWYKESNIDSNLYIYDESFRLESEVMKDLTMTSDRLWLKFVFYPETSINITDGINIDKTLYPNISNFYVHDSSNIYPEINVLNPLNVNDLYSYTVHHNRHENSKFIDIVYKFSSMLLSNYTRFRTVLNELIGSFDRRDMYQFKDILNSSYSNIYLDNFTKLNNDLLENIMNYTLSHQMEINQILHSNNNEVVKEPVKITDSLQVLYED